MKTTKHIYQSNTQVTSHGLCSSAPGHPLLHQGVYYTLHNGTIHNVTIVKQLWHDIYKVLHKPVTGHIFTAYDKCESYLMKSFVFEEHIQCSMMQEF